MLTENHISKYNVGSSDFTAPSTDKTVILVPGQVEDDTSIRYGSPQIYCNLNLLRTVREHNPDAYIIYKPHPDVVSGNRIGHISPEDAARYADQTVEQADILTCLQYADEVHTMTSLTGFEALLRGKKVSCYGLPFSMQAGGLPKICCPFRAAAAGLSFGSWLPARSSTTPTTSTSKPIRPSMRKPQPKS